MKFRLVISGEKLRVKYIYIVEMLLVWSLEKDRNQICNFVKIERIEIMREIIWSSSACKSIRISFFARARADRHGATTTSMRLFPVTFLASDSNARASIESRMNDRHGDVDTRSSISWRHVGRRQRREAVVLRPCDRYVTDWHTTTTDRKMCSIYVCAPVAAYFSRRE